MKNYLLCNDKEKEKKEEEEAKYIVAQIMEHGVTEKQILSIINDLALNLENNTYTKKILLALNFIKSNELKYGIEGLDV